MKASTTIDDATLAEIVEEMGGDGVWVHPALAREQGISAADETRLEQVVAGAEHTDLRVVLVDLDYRDDRFQGNFTSLTAWLHDDLGGDAVYVGVHAGPPHSLRLEEYGEVDSDAFYAGRVAELEHPDDLVAQVERTVELLDTGGARELYMEIPVDERYDNPSSGSDGAAGGVWMVVTGAVLVVGAVMAVQRWKKRKQGANSARPASLGARPRPGFVLPVAVLRTVRAAEDRQLRQRAETEVLALGEALARENHGSTVPALEAWRGALDHYDAARTILAGAGSPADVVGALVLVRRGEDARTYAAGEVAEPWEPRTGCYFNPLHGDAAQRVRWASGTSGASAEVPACGDCATAVQAGQEPDDVLDFVSGDSTVHYFRLDLGAWSETGYGAVTPDLLGELRRARSGRRIRTRRSRRQAVLPK